jgi:hypothetical protein
MLADVHKLIYASCSAVIQYAGLLEAPNYVGDLNPINVVEFQSTENSSLYSVAMAPQCNLCV